MSVPSTCDRESPSPDRVRVELLEKSRTAVPPALRFDTTLPVLVFKTGRNPLHHGTLGIIRSLGKAGVPVYALVEDGFAPAALSRYLTGYFVRQAHRPPDGPLHASDKTSPYPGESQLLSQLLAIAQKLGVPALLLPTDDLGAVFIAEHAEALKPYFRFPALDPALPGLVSNKRDLHFLCTRLEIPSPKFTSPSSLDEAQEFASRCAFPVIVKADPAAVSSGVRSVSVVRTPEQLLGLYRSVASPDSLLCQEYIPEDCAEDWIFHGYSNPQNGCYIGFTGKKLLSWPRSAGATTLGVSIANPVLREQSIRLLKGLQYAGIVDLDYRFDKRDGQYKLLDFNPRVGANFRMFENEAGIDVVRALHLDLTGGPVPDAPQIDGRRFVVESQYWLAGLSDAIHGESKLRDCLRSIRKPREFAWFSTDDPLPSFAVGSRLLFRLAQKLLDAAQSITLRGRAARNRDAEDFRQSESATSPCFPQARSDGN